MTMTAPMNGKVELMLNGDAVEYEEEESKKAPGEGVLPPLYSLKCNTCQDFLTSAVTLQCLHSYCQTCLETYNRDIYANESKTEENGEPSPRPVVCPVCSDDLGLVLPAVASSPFENSRLNRIVGLVESDNIVCQNCEATTSEMKCQTCNAWLCVPCMEATHAAPIFKTHVTERLTHEQMMAAPKCPQHPLSDLEFFSTDEEVGVCQVCLLKGEFVGKPYCLVSDVRKLRQADIEKGVEVVLNEREKLLVGKDSAEETLAELSDNLEAQTAAVKENFASIRKALDAREAETLKALTKLKEVKAGVLNKQLEQTENIIAVMNDGIQNVDLVLNHSNDLELVYMTVVLQEFIADLSKLNAQRFKNGMMNMSYYHQPAVDASLPVILSDRVPQLVGAYASVPTMEVEGGKVSKVEKTKVTKLQKEALDEVAGAQANSEEYGCAVQ